MDVQKEKKKKVDPATVDSMVATIIFIVFMIAMIVLFVHMRFS